MPPARTAAERGHILVGVLVTIILISGLIYASTTISNVGVGDSRRALEKTKAYWVAQAGAERGIAFLKGAARRTAVHDPLFGLNNLFTDGTGALRTLAPFVGEPVSADGHRAGQFTVTMEPTAIQDGYEIAIRSTGYFPVAPVNREPGTRHPVHSSVETVVQLRLEPGRVFDYGYFVNHWGWLYGSGITCHGNVRSNGQLDAASFDPTVTGQPRYTGMVFDGTNVLLQGYIDDNEDGVLDGSDGGIYSAWDIVNVENVRGPGEGPPNLHDFRPAHTMPSLVDLTVVEQRAAASGGRVLIGTTQVADAVVGDDSSENPNLFAYGTPTEPVHIDGIVVVRGHAIVRGTITGQGALFVGGNLYVPGDLVYADPPATPRPASNLPADTALWIAANRDRDMIGFFARESISVGDITDWAWRDLIGSWMSNPMNRSDEDAGEDGIHGTVAGYDGTMGTVDDDVLEDDGIWTVEYYTVEDEELGLLPPGRRVGDVVPGSGEDIDGDGSYDGTLQITDLDPDVPLDPAFWEGNMDSWSGGGSTTTTTTTMTTSSTTTSGGGESGSGSTTYSFSSFATNDVARLDGVFYTNHAFSVYSTHDGLELNGALVCRNEQVIYTGSFTIHQDCRLLGRMDSVAAPWMPRTLDRIEVVGWRPLRKDPNHAVGQE